MPEILQTLREQRKFEERNANGLKQVQGKAESPFLWAILEIIIMDSTKHKAVCDALIEMTGGQGDAAIPESMLEERTVNKLREHVTLEADMLCRLEAIKPEVSGNAQALIDYMLEEEQRHHTVLLGLTKLLDVGEASMERYYALADTLMNKAHQPGKAPRTKS